MNRSSILVSPKGYDDVYVILAQLGFGHAHQLPENEMERLADRSFLAQFGNIFLNCHRAFDSPDAEVVFAMHDFVEAGGVLYGSDWASTLIAAAFGGEIVFSRHSGQNGIVKAKVKDASLRRALGPEVNINFDMTSWDRVERPPSAAQVYFYDESWAHPLALQFPYGSAGGKIVYTSYHHHAQTASSAGERALLEWLVMLPTQHRQVAQVSRVMCQYGNQQAATTLVGRTNRSASDLLKLGLDAPGTAVVALSWEPRNQLEYSIRYMRKGDEIGYRQSDEPPIAISVRDPKIDDAVEIRVQDRNSDANDRDEPFPYVLGASVRRHLLGDSDWFAFTLMRLLESKLDGVCTLDAIRNRVKFETMMGITGNLLGALGYSVRSVPVPETGRPGSIIARSTTLAESKPDLIINVAVFLDPPLARSELKLGSNSPVPQAIESSMADVEVDEFVDTTERLLIVAALVTTDGRFDPDEQTGQVANAGLDNRWRLVSACKQEVVGGKGSVAPEDLLNPLLLYVLIYRWE